MIKTKNIYAPGESSDGWRLLVMRRWPRGIKKERVDAWEPELAPSLNLLQQWRGGQISWQQFSQDYAREVAAKPQLAELRRRTQEGAVTLLCSCRDEGRCHRSQLRDLVLAEGGG